MLVGVAAAGVGQSVRTLRGGVDGPGGAAAELHGQPSLPGKPPMPRGSCRRWRSQGTRPRRASAHPPGCRGRRKCVLLPGQPRLPAQARDQSGHPGEGRPSSQPHQARKCRRAAVTLNTARYRDRNTVERCINKIKVWRGQATRCDITPDNHMAGFQLRGSIIWIPSLRPAT